MTAFPFNPSNGDTHIIGENNWEYDSTYGVWNKTSGGVTGNIGPTGATGLPPGVPYLPLSGLLEAVDSAGDIKITTNQVEVYKTDSNSTDLSDYFNNVDHGRLHIVQEEDSEKFILFDYNSAPLSSNKYTFSGSIAASNGLGGSSPYFGSESCRIFYVNDGATGATGATGSDVGLSYTVQAGTPSAGQVYRHHDKIKPSDTDGDGNDVGDYWGAAKIGDQIYYFQDDRTGYEISTITAKIDQTSYWEFTISTVDSSSVPTDTGIPVHLYYVAQGPTGPTGPDGASDVAIFSVSTSPKSSISVGSKTTALYRVPYDSTVQQFDVKVSKTGGFTAAAYIAGSDFGAPATNSISGCCLGVSGLTGSSTVFNVSSLTAGNFLYLDVISNTSGSTQAQAFLTYERR